MLKAEISIRGHLQAPLRENVYVSITAAASAHEQEQPCAHAKTEPTAPSLEATSATMAQRQANIRAGVIQPPCAR